MPISPQSKAYQEGQSARQIGVPIEHNPYEVGSSKYEHWEAGWEAGPVSQSNPVANDSPSN